MNLKTPLEALARKLFPPDEAATDANAADRPGDGAGGAPRRCPAGHVMDPSWAVCPYCKAEQDTLEKTMQARDDKPAAAGEARATRIEAAPSAGRTTRVDTPEPPADQRRTGQAAGQAAGRAAGPAASADARRIAGVLVTYSWQPAGQLFPIREGKNYIGAGRVADEGGIDCQVQITTDPEMSGTHALILCRHGRYDLVDLNSSNGTFVDGQMVPTQAGVELSDRAAIRTGATVWKFLRIDAGPPSGGAAGGTPPAGGAAGGGASDLTEVP